MNNICGNRIPLKQILILTEFKTSFPKIFKFFDKQMIQQSLKSLGPLKFSK